MKQLQHLLKIALEDIADGKTHVEREHVFYGKLTDLKELDKAASSEWQEQWEIKLPKTDKNIGSGSVRVRSTRPGKDKAAVYTLTCKAFTAEDGAKLESTLEATEDMFNMFAALAASGMRKVRFNFPVDGLTFEVDVYLKDDGSFAEWVKIDLEVPDGVTKIPALPVTLTEMVKQSAQNTDEERSFIRGLYDNVFLTTKRIVDPVQQDTA